ncbi:SET domain-containing protein [Thozetella sp. PMI_491]|nr:SET domain-containing protein [Thozetella sp. PMI_491]
MGLASPVFKVLAAAAVLNALVTGEYLATKVCPTEIHSPFQPPHHIVCPVPIDDTSTPSSFTWTPWTHHPQCANQEDDPAKKLCVYTNSEHGLGGISIVTTPFSAAEATRILNEPLAPDSSLELLANMTRGGELPYKIVDIPGKGKGVIATRKIAKYEVIMADYASLAVDMSLPALVQRMKGYKLLHVAADQLADPGRAMTLGRSNEQAADVIEDILRTNAFHTILAGQPHMVLFPEVSRMNHACRPNAYTRFVPENLGTTVGAAMDIEPGEEITISYLTFGQTFDERQKSLKRWSFNCTCSLCAAGKERGVSDKKRKQIEALREKAGEAYHEAKASDAIRYTVEALELMRQEELFPMYSEQFENLARIYWAVGDWKMATQHARKSLDLLKEQGYIEGYNERHLASLLQSFD